MASPSRARRILAALAVAAMTTGAVVAVRRHLAAEPGSAVQRRSRRARTTTVAVVGAKVGADYASHRARRLFADAARREQLDTQFELRTAQQVADTLGNMKGAVMKLGQMASCLDQGLPEPIRATLADLQSDAPPMSAELAASVIVEELGDAPEVVFQTWDPVPIASASIGQVHRAITWDDRAVAVKVQYPGIADAMSSDLGNLGLVFGGLGQLFPGLEPGPLVDELRERLTEELDYEREAANQHRFARAYEGHPTIHIPAVVDEHSTGRVLTTELATGSTWAELLAWDQAERDLAAETLYRFAFGSLYGLHMFNGDPQPGNYLFEPGGRVTFLDFGLVKYFSPEEITSFEDMIIAMVVDRDTTAFRRTIEEIGLLDAEADFDEDEIDAYFGHFYEFVRERGVSTVTPEYASETVRRFFDRSGPHGDIMGSVNLPPSMVVIQRINLGLYALFGELRATGDWRAIAEEVWPFTAGPPSTEMGQRIAAWEQFRAAGSLR
jgi:predicted unusual protein kinase regulating ubiquinone biosynthesis (AarF/ABC1/UbiB family)